MLDLNRDMLMSQNECSWCEASLKMTQCCLFGARADIQRRQAAFHRGWRTTTVCHIKYGNTKTITQTSRKTGKKAKTLPSLQASKCRPGSHTMLVCLCAFIAPLILESALMAALALDLASVPASRSSPPPAAPRPAARAFLRGAIPSISPSATDDRVPNTSL
jgi:hypothetical protein